MCAPLQCTHTHIHTKFKYQILVMCEHTIFDIRQLLFRRVNTAISFSSENPTFALFRIQPVHGWMDGWICISLAFCFASVDYPRCDDDFPSHFIVCKACN